jgi:hypothetical protein
LGIRRSKGGNEGRGQWNEVQGEGTWSSRGVYSQAEFRVLLDSRRVVVWEKTTYDIDRRGSFPFISFRASPPHTPRLTGHVRTNAKVRETEQTDGRSTRVRVGQGHQGSQVSKQTPSHLSRNVLTRVCVSFIVTRR